MKIIIISYNNAMVVFGGYDGGVKNDVHMLDLQKNSWNGPFFWPIPAGLYVCCTGGAPTCHIHALV